VRSSHAARLPLIPGVLDQANSEDDAKALPGLRANRPSGKEKDFNFVWVNRNWRVTFKFIGVNVEIVDYLDYH